MNRYLILLPFEDDSSESRIKVGLTSYSCATKSVDVFANAHTINEHWRTDVSSLCLLCRQATKIQGTKHGVDTDDV